jgi:hypothetical protein
MQTTDEQQQHPQQTSNTARNTYSTFCFQGMLRSPHAAAIALFIYKLYKNDFSCR